ncbi:MAG: methionine ABC transporter ATP-binding protein [Candidatus Nanopelagicales bacterium]
MIEIRDVRKVFPGQNGREVVAVDGVSLDVAKGDIQGVIGQSGAGKSTLIRVVNLLERPTSGTVSVAGQELTTLNSKELRAARRKIGMIFQHFNLLDSRTIAANVAFPLELAGMNKIDRTAKVKQLLDLVGLGHRLEAYPSQLSGGMKQRVAIARALADDPVVLLSDEATSALDPETTASILALLREIRDRLGLTILLITHEMGVVTSICEHVAVMEGGKVTDSGTVLEVASRHGSALARDLLPRIPAGALDPAYGVVVEVVGVGAVALEPAITRVAGDLGLQIAVVGGSVTEIAGEPFSRLLLRPDLPPEQAGPFLARLAAEGLTAAVAAEVAA